MNEANENIITGLSEAARQDMAAVVGRVIQDIIPPLIAHEIEKLAIMVQHGFQDVYEKMATKEDMRELRSDLNAFRKEMGISVDKFEARLDDHEERLGYLEAASL
ncbi:MAG TPA: hypothetical protein VFQ72_03820 [Candidatus Paceibacterota bacterium]|nr:hypothetical protein [Candidatus Paceibacterota bacterium]